MTAEESVLALGRTSLTCQKQIGQAAPCDARFCLLSVRFPLLLGRAVRIVLWASQNHSALFFATVKDSMRTNDNHMYFCGNEVRIPIFAR